MKLKKKNNLGNYEFHIIDNFQIIKFTNYLKTYLVYFLLCGIYTATLCRVGLGGLKFVARRYIAGKKFGFRFCCEQKNKKSSPYNYI